MAESEGAKRPGWRSLIYFWDGGWIGVGTAQGVVPPHAHHAVQVTLGLDRRIAFREPDGEWIECDGAIITPNVQHSFDGRDAHVMMLFVDPECLEGRWLRNSLRSPIQTVPAERFESYRPALVEFQQTRPSIEDASKLITAIARALCDGPPPQRKMDDRIARALQWLRGREPRGITLEEVAREAFLSSSRFAHLFTAEVGLPFRRYLLWRKLKRAMDAFGRGGTLTDAAYEAGFSDSAHLTRTFYQMFGLPPSIMIGSAELYEIPAPFEVGGEGVW